MRDTLLSAFGAQQVRPAEIVTYQRHSTEKLAEVISSSYPAPWLTRARLGVEADPFVARWLSRASSLSPCLPEQRIDEGAAPRVLRNAPRAADQSPRKRSR